MCLYFHRVPCHFFRLQRSDMLRSNDWFAVSCNCSLNFVYGDAVIWHSNTLLCPATSWHVLEILSTIFKVFTSVWKLFNKFFFAIMYNPDSLFVKQRGTRLNNKKHIHSLNCRPSLIECWNLQFRWPRIKKRADSNIQPTLSNRKLRNMLTAAKSQVQCKPDDQNICDVFWGWQCSLLLHLLGIALVCFHSWLGASCRIISQEPYV